MKRDQRFEALDGLRGIAAVAVMLAHLVLDYPHSFGTGPAPWWTLPGWEQTAYFAGFIPVAVFFTISGYVIGLTFERGCGVRAFARNRIARLYPLALIALIGTQVLAALPADPFLPSGPARLMASATLLPEVFGHEPFNPVAWSLSVELRFYALALLAAVTGASGRWLFLWLAMAGLVTAGALPDSAFLTWAVTVKYAPYLVAGLALHALRDGPSAWPLAWLAAGAALVGVAVPGVPAVLILSSWAVMHGARRGAFAWLAARPLRHLGRISYALYLIHMPLGYVSLWWLTRAGLPFGVALAIALLASLGLAHLLTVRFDEPFRRRLRERRPAARHEAGLTRLAGAR